LAVTYFWATMYIHVLTKYRRPRTHIHVYKNFSELLIL